MLIVLIHHVAMMIQAPHVVASVSADLDDAIERLFPERIGEPSDSDVEQANPQSQECKLGDDYVVIPSNREGYIQAIAAGTLVRTTKDENIILRLRSRPGDSISVGTPLADIWPADKRPIEELSVETLQCSLNESVIVGIRRTSRQDVECAVDELVEVAVRSLSPGINDPCTAMNCIDWLGAALGRLAERRKPTAYRCDEDGNLRVIAHSVSFPDVLDAAMNQIRQYGRDSVAVTIRLLEALASIAQHVQSDDDREAVKRHAEMIARCAESIREDNDIQEIQARHGQIQQHLEQDAETSIKHKEYSRVR